MHRPRSRWFSSFPLFLLFLKFTASRKHDIEINDDERPYIPISTFGFLDGGLLFFNLTDFHVRPNKKSSGVFGFVLEKTGMYGLAENKKSKEFCENRDSDSNSLFFWMEIGRTSSSKKQFPTLTDMHIQCASEISSFLTVFQDGMQMQKLLSVRMQNDKENSDDVIKYNTSFNISFLNSTAKGLYTFAFYGCPMYQTSSIRMTIKAEVVESNPTGFLSAGEARLPILYVTSSGIFFIIALFWFFKLRQSIDGVFKIHYVMLLLAILASLSFLAHSINYHFINSFGIKEESWAILYYIVHLLKGLLLFLTLVLIGTGWAFIKHIFSDNDRKVFMFIIPLQVFANIAQIILEEMEEWVVEYQSWKHVFVFVDLLCCGAVLFPILWSIRHLQEGAKTDGKAAKNLARLHLFRRFYITIVFYIYFTRLVVYLVGSAFPFEYPWLTEMFKVLATLVLFLATGYMFRPGSDNLYSTVPTEDEEYETTSEGNQIVTTNFTIERRSGLKRLQGSEA
eukprot:m.106914 g.106914  ORF g.106914 m.106914 type:complete len:508 (+) comp37272_c0_seq27:55-1578(+)